MCVYACVCTYMSKIKNEGDAEGKARQSLNTVAFCLQSFTGTRENNSVSSPDHCPN